MVAVFAACTPIADTGDADPSQASPTYSAEDLPVLDGGLGQQAMGGLLGGVAAARDGAVPETSVNGTLLQGPFVAYLESGDVERARRSATQTLNSLPSGQTRIWRNPLNGHWGTMTPTRTYLNADGVYCREYRQTVTIGGLEHQAGGTACLRGDGVWQVVS